MKPLLTIAIPTYNRIDCLRLLIDRLHSELSSIPDWESVVEVFVVNNASSDGTRDYLDELGRSRPFRVYHNDENLGMDGNFIRCFQLASGSWFWLFSDDDLPMLGSIRLIIDSLRKPTACSMIYLPALFQAGSLEGNDLRTDPAQLLQSESASRFAARVNGLFTFISCMIVKRIAFLDWVPSPDFESLRGSLFSFFEWEFELLKRSDSFGYFTGAMVVARAENSRGYDFVRVFTEQFNKACRLKLGERPDLFDRVTRGMRYRHLPALFYKTRIGRNGLLVVNSRQAKRDYIRAYGGGPFYFLVMYPILAFPIWFVRPALFLGRVWGKVWLEASRYSA
jgi:abequosyltransferase